MRNKTLHSLLCVILVGIAIAIQGCAGMQGNFGNQAGASSNESAAFLEELGDKYSQIGKVDDALGMYGKALAVGGPKEKVGLKIANIYRSKGEWEQALKAYLTALTEKPDSMQALYGTGESHFRLNQYHEAAGYFLRALQTKPDSTESRHFLGVVRNHQNLPELAIEEFQLIIRQGKANAKLYNDLGLSHLMRSEYDKAVSAFRESLLREQSAEAFNNLGLTLCRQQKYREAFEAFKRGSGEAVAHNNIGYFFYQKGDYRRAAEHFEKAVEINPVFYSTASDNLDKARMALQK